VRLCVTGGRDFESRDELFAALDSVHRETPIDLLVHGDCRTGVDHLAIQWCLSHDVHHTGSRWRPQWNVFKRSRAVPIRNGAMLEIEQPDALLAFPGDRWSDDCVRKARSLGIQVIDYSSTSAISSTISE
jgi:hypothetical protein